MPPPLPSSHRGMTANPLKPSRYRPGKPIAEEPSSSEEEEEDEEEKRREQERRRQERRRKQQAPKATSFPGASGTGTITKGVKNATIEQDEDEEDFITEEEEEEEEAAVAEDEQSAEVPPRIPTAQISGVPERIRRHQEEEEEESSEEESSSEEEAPRRVLLRPTFIKKDKRANTAGETQHGQAAGDSAAEAEAQKAQRQKKADALIREQLERDAIARSAANKAWDDDEVEVADEEAIDDTDGKDPEAEYAAWKLREFKRIKREREAIEVAEKEREEIERRRNLTAEEREREDSEFIEKQKEEREAARGQTGFMQRYFHKGAFFRPDLEREGLDKRAVMGAKFADDVSRETLPQYMQIRDMTKLGKKGRTRYKDLKSEDTGRFGVGFGQGSRRQGGPSDITDERFLPDRGDGPRGPTGANASAIRERRRSRSRSHSPKRDRRGDRYSGRERDRSSDRYRPENSSRRKRSPSPYEDRDKRRRMRSAS